MNRAGAFEELETIRPHVMALLKLHGAAQTAEARDGAAGLIEDAFLAAVWHAARDLLENGWSPGALPPSRPVPANGLRAPAGPRLRLVGGVDAA